MRRRPGVGFIQQDQSLSTRYTSIGQHIAQTEVQNLSKQLLDFKHHLENYARDHRNEIIKNPEFRVKFHEMCQAIGVDPLTSRKNYWAEFLGVGDFYYELGIRIIDLAITLRPLHGFLIPLTILTSKLSRDNQVVSEDDCKRAIKLLKPLGGGYKVVGETKSVLRCLPPELNEDYARVMEIAKSKGGHVQAVDLVTTLKWTTERSQAVLDVLIHEGMAWLDAQCGQGLRYWFPNLWSSRV